MFGHQLDVLYNFIGGPMTVLYCTCISLCAFLMYSSYQIKRFYYYPPIRPSFRRRQLSTGRNISCTSFQLGTGVENAGDYVQVTQAILSAVLMRHAPCQFAYMFHHQHILSYTGIYKHCCHIRSLPYRAPHLQSTPHQMGVTWKKHLGSR